MDDLVDKELKNLKSNPVFYNFDLREKYFNV